MKSTILTLSIAFCGLSFGADNCTSSADATHKKVSAKPESVLEVVAADVAASPKCACPIVKAAIAASKADGDLRGDIVAAAINAAPDEAAAIKACLPASTAGHGKGSGSGKEVTGKEPVAGATTDDGGSEEDSWFDPLIYGAGGMGAGGVAAAGGYASAPGSGGGAGLEGNPEEVIEVIETGDGDGPIVVVRPSTK